MSIKASEISELIKERIERFAAAAEARNVGTVVSVTDGICRIHGLADVRYGEMIEFPDSLYGLALNLERDSVGAVVLGRLHLDQGRRYGQDHRAHPRSADRAELLGRVVDALGPAHRRQGRPSTPRPAAPIERVAPGVIYRQSVSQPVQTGYKAIDAMVPVGRGQRELIIGDRQTGKTALAIDTIINQKSSGREMHLRCDRAEAVLDRQRRAQARGAQRHGPYDRRGRLRLRAALACSTSRPIPA
jgi:F-type H+-transporting ATPase subunit alpha